MIVFIMIHGITLVEAYQRGHEVLVLTFSCSGPIGSQYLTSTKYLDGRVELGWRVVPIFDQISSGFSPVPVW